MTTESVISKVWSFCHTLRDDGVGYGDYLEQLTYLIFLKMADEYAKPPYNRDVGVPKKYNWASLRALKGAELEGHYIETLRELGTEKGMLGQIFTKAQNKIQDPAKLARVIEMVNDTEWVTLDSDVKGDIYEGILERNAEDTKSGAGQYFTPRSLIAAMVECVAPEPGKTIADPACGTGGFFLAAYDYLVKHHKLNRDQKTFLKTSAFQGNEIVSGTRRLCLMNLFLHNIGEIDGESLVSPTDALVMQPSQTVDCVLANPPFGKKSSMTFTNEEGEQEKDELTYNLRRRLNCRPGGSVRKALPMKRETRIENQMGPSAGAVEFSSPSALFRMRSSNEEMNSKRNVRFSATRRGLFVKTIYRNSASARRETHRPRNGARNSTL